MLNIFIVDDSEEKVIRIEKVIKESFLPQSIQITIARSTSQAMGVLLSRNIIDLMILDLNLPVRPGEGIKDKSGLNLLKEITRRNDISQPDSIIGLTSFDDIKSQVNERFNIEGWVVAKFNLKESDWEELIKNKIAYLMTKKMDKKLSRTTPLVVILTAIKEEYRAVKAHLINLKDNDLDDTSYEIGDFYWNDGLVANVVIRECGAKNSIAAMETERAIQNYSPDLIIFVGIAGSRKGNDFKIGDVVIPEKIYSYEAGKSDKEMFSARPDSGFLTYAFIEKAKKERLKDEWKSMIKGTYKDYCPNADLGIIASGDQLVEHYDSSVGTILTKYYNDTSAIEMEGFGFSKTLSKQGRNQSSLISGLVRGISDIIERDDSQSINQDKRPYDAKELASDAASAFAYWMIYKFYGV
ncbi:response regulator [Lacihabitans sp. CCS-44]|uniref:phosphorylase family protein n=1 Tax=Lacihabitans sp. CCS-44 TaxID=2487331 RepID=UPI0020CC7F9F|nr:hypothetical protein [Lacihabitans sp. CCS-44]MCP9756854.1 response regulator [Lacihabitans sp. CCS-44]